MHILQNGIEKLTLEYDTIFTPDDLEQPAPR